METLDLPGRALYFLHQIAPIPLYEQQHPTPDICRVDAIVGPEIGGLDHVRLEMCNYALHGSVVGMAAIGGIPVPTFDIDDRTAAERSLVMQQMSCFRSMVLDARANLRSDSITLGEADLADVVARLYALLSQENCLPTAFGASHNREDLHTLAALRLLPP
jgi:hypothetical protein